MCPALYEADTRLYLTWSLWRRKILATREPSTQDIRRFDNHRTLAHRDVVGWEPCPMSESKREGLRVDFPTHFGKYVSDLSELAVALAILFLG